MIVFVTGGSGFVGGHLIQRLAGDGYEVRALARSSAAEAAVIKAGAAPVRGDLNDVAAMSRGMTGASVVVHSAAMLTAGPRQRQQMHDINVVGTQNVIRAAESARVGTLVHVSTEQVLFGERPLVRVDETFPYPRHPRGAYGITKRQAEELVLAASSDTMRTVAVRPRFVWGVGDTTVLPAIVEGVRSGTFRWIDGGRYLTSTCNVVNVVDGILAAMNNGRPGRCYFLTDGEPQEFRTFVTALLDTQGITAPTASMPRTVAMGAAALTELFWSVTRKAGPPPLDRTLVGVIGSECTVIDNLARNEIGYRPSITVEQGLANLRLLAGQSRP